MSKLHNLQALQNSSGHQQERPMRRTRNGFTLHNPAGPNGANNFGLQNANQQHNGGSTQMLPRQNISGQIENDKSPYYTKTQYEGLSRSTEQKFMNSSQRANSNMALGIQHGPGGSTGMALNQDFSEKRIKNGAQSTLFPADNPNRLFKSTESLPKNDNSNGTVPKIPHISQTQGSRRNADNQGQHHASNISQNSNRLANQSSILLAQSLKNQSGGRKGQGRNIKMGGLNEFNTQTSYGTANANYFASGSNMNQNIVPIQVVQLNNNRHKVRRKINSQLMHGNSQSQQKQ